jgi:hypothetical protein
MLPPEGLREDEEGLEKEGLDERDDKLDVDRENE